MPNMPSRSDVHVNRPLTNIMVAQIQDMTSMIADQMFPPVPVQKQADRYFKYSKETYMRGDAAKRGPGSESAGGGFHIDNTPTYFCDVYAFHTDVDDQTRKNYDDPLKPDEDGVSFVTSHLMLKREKVFVSKYFAPNTWQGHKVAGVAADFTPSILWSADNSNPILDVRNLANEMKSGGLYRPNVMAVSPDVMTRLENHPLIIDRYKYTQAGILTKDLIARAFSLDKILIADAVVATNQEGQLTTGDFLLKNKFLLAYAPPAPGLRVPTAGYNFQWTGYQDAGSMGNDVVTFRMPHLRSDRIEAEWNYSMNIICADLGILGVGLL